MKDHGKTVFISSHLLSEVEKMITHVGIINRGKLLFQGTLKDLQDINKSQIIIISDNLAESVNLLVNNGYPAELVFDTIRIPFSTLDDIASITALLVNNDHKIYGISQTKGNLEDLFISITQS